MFSDHKDEDHLNNDSESFSGFELLEVLNNSQEKATELLVNSFYARKLLKSVNPQLAIQLLHASARYDERPILAVVEYCIKSMVSIEAVNSQQQTALSIAIQHQCFNVIALLLNAGAAIDSFPP